MAKITKALANPELLLWARKYSHLSIEEAAKKLNIKNEKIKKWEDGLDYPTILQLRKLSKAYHQPFTFFYLPSPPQIKTPQIEDYRKIPSESIEDFSKEVFLEIRDSIDKRDIALELMAELNQSPSHLSFPLSPNDDPNDIGIKIRELLQISFNDQIKFEDSRQAFNSWREGLEKLGVLVFQSSKIPISTMRGLSVALSPLPIIIINRKDSYQGRIFSLLHEFTHILLNKAGLCDLHYEYEQTDNMNTEVFCNLIAASTLLPQKWFYEDSPNKNIGRINHWTDDEIEYLSNRYCVSREVIVRRLLNFGLVTNGFYTQKREEYLKEIKKRKKRTGFVPPALDVVSKSGKPYINTVFEAFTQKHITESTVSEYLGVKNKHFNKIRSLVGA